MMFFLAFTITLTGCGEKGLENNPPLEATVTSNGGMSVIKGDYLYFVNGYVDETSLTKDDNKAGKVTKGAIYRTRLDSNEIVKDKDGFLLSDRTDRVVSKVVGFGNGGFYIIDNYIIYATPYMKLSSTGELQTSRVEFHRVNIDGTEDTVLFVTASALSEWSTYKIGDTPYIVAYEGSRLVSVNVKTAKTVATISDTTSYAILKDEEYGYSDSRTNLPQTHIIYTRGINASQDDVATSSYKGNAVCALNIATGESTTLELGRENSYTIKHVNENTVYYTFTSATQTEACLYKRVLENPGDSALVDFWRDSAETRLTKVGYGNYIFVGYGNDLIVANDSADDGSTWILEGAYAPRQLVASKKDILAVFGDYAYYINENKLFRLNIHETKPEPIDAYAENKTTLINNAKFLDFDGMRVYVYAEYTAENGDTNYYLNYFAENFTQDSFEERFVGVFENGDTPEKPEQPEPEFEGQEVEYVPHID